MADYQTMYLKLFRAVEKATNLLIEAQQECEDLYVNSVETVLKLVSISSEQNESTEKN